MVNTSQLKHPHTFTSNHIINSLQQTSYILTIASLTGCMVHFLFIFLFIYLNQSILAWLNILSVLAWLSTLWFNRVKRHEISVLIMNTEVLIHAIAATSLLGIDAGFQYYLWPMTLLLMVVPCLKITWSAILAFINIAIFATLCLFFHDGLDSLNAYYPPLLIFNLMGASLPFITTAAVSRYAYSNQYLSMVKLAERDELTQLFNRRFGLEALNYYIDYLKNNHVPFCISLVDVDYFKRVNDQLGHNKGDEILVKIANYLSKSMRETDISSRWGGEEFLFIFPNVELCQIQQRIETICQDMPNNISVKNWDQTISCSFGLIQVKQGETAEEALKRVDSSLYQAKKNGRYQVVSDH
ncbi:MAG: GGDEF domain-containing protein [Oceanospirillaceae bacterium]|nr:GGDEF domain-containing protein [Oceanospirillaceae bacterium]